MKRRRSLLSSEIWVTVVITGASILCLPLRGLRAEEQPASPLRPAMTEDPSTPGETGWLEALLARKTITGDWGGLRRRLRERGLSPELSYTIEMLSNVDGGRRRDTEVLGNVDLLLTTDLEQLLGWEGGTLFLYGLGNHGGNPSSDVGDLQVVSNIEAVDTWRLYEAWLQQELLEHKLSFLIGLYDFNSEFDVLPTAEIFLNSSFGVGADIGQSGRNGPSIFPVTSLGGRLEIRPAEPFYLRAVVLDGVPGDPDEPRGTEVRLRGADGLLLAAEIGFVNNPKPRLESGDRAHARHQEDPLLAEAQELPRGYFGKVALGVWGYTTELEAFAPPAPGKAPRTHRGPTGVYLLGEQRLYFEEAAPYKGLGAFLRLGITESRVNIVDGYVGGGVVYRGLFPYRDLDRIGIGVAAAHLGSEYREAARGPGPPLEEWEVTLELTYHARVAGWLALQPDIQYVMSPGGDPSLRDALVVGLRAILAF